MTEKQRKSTRIGQEWGAWIRKRLVRPQILLRWRPTGKIAQTVETGLAILVGLALNIVILLRSQDSMLLSNLALGQQLAGYQRKGETVALD